MADQLDISTFVVALLDSAPDESRDKAAVELVSRAAGHMTALIGSKASSEVLYKLADHVATQGGPPDA